jgi:hypothetical protein
MMMAGHRTPSPFGETASRGPISDDWVLDESG